MLFRVVFVALCVSAVFSAGPLDNVVLDLLENDVRPALANLTIPDVNTTVNATGVLLSLVAEGIATAYLDNFTIAELQTSLIPVRLDNLTLFWDSVEISAQYNLSGIVDIEQLQGPVFITGDGLAEIRLQELSLTAAASITSFQGNYQIKEIYGLDVHLSKANVTLENIFGGGDMEEMTTVFFSFFIPQYINDSGKGILEQLAPFIKDEINKVLAKNDTIVEMYK